VILADLIAWRAMRKEPPGFDPEDNDWHFQHLPPDREVFRDDKDTCIGCHRREECARRDYMCTEPGARSTASSTSRERIG
jgi:hypothetical protein